jgi:hypothetical protein
MQDPTSQLVDQIDALLELFPEIESSWWSSSMGGGFKKSVEYEGVITQSISLVRHIYGPNHPNAQRLIHFVNGNSLHSLHQIRGLLIGARVDLLNGLIHDLAARITLDIKADFLV